LAQKSRNAAEEAFGYIEQAKSRSLAELVFGRGNPLTWLRLEGATGDRITTLRQELNWCYRRLEIEQTRPDGISPHTIRDLHTQARAREDTLLQAIRELPYRGGAEPVLEEPAAGTLDEIRAALDDETTLLEYFEADSHLLAAVVTRSDLDVIPLGKAAEVVSALRMLEFQLSNVTLKGSGRSGFGQTRLMAAENRLRELYRLLIAPLESLP
jgi:hypothetical protein